MNIHEMPSLVKRTKKRIGRGTSSGRGKTSGRGHKGDKARGKSPWYKVGGSRRSRLLKHLPQRRGIGNSGLAIRRVIVTLAQLDALYDKGETVTIATLAEKGLIYANETVKLLNKGAITKALTVEIPVSDSAKQAIEKAGGSVESK